MIFQHTFNQVVERRKTQTRRVAYEHEVAIRGVNNRILAVTSGGRVKWCVGQTYAVQPGRGKSGVARIRLIGINSQKLGRIRNADARLEGFSNRKAFLDTWEQIHGDVDLNLRVWVLTFELVDETEREADLLYAS